MTDYTDFDKQLLLLIAGGVSSFGLLVKRLEPHAKLFCSAPSQLPMRVVDRRLQVLRKRNLIAYEQKTGWSIVKL